MELSRISNFIKAVLALTAVIPGVALFARLVALPPDFHQLLQICGSILAPVTVMLSVLLRDSIARMKPLIATAAAVIFLVFGFALALNYLQFADEHVEPISYESYGYAVPKDKQKGWYVVRPSSPSGELQALLEEHDSLAAALHDPRDGQEVARLVKEQSRPDQWRMFWQVLVTELLLLCGFLLAAWRAAASLAPAEETPQTP